MQRSSVLIKLKENVKCTEKVPLLPRKTKLNFIMHIKQKSLNFMNFVLFSKNEKLPRILLLNCS